MIILIAFKATVLFVGYVYEKKFFQIFNINELATEDIQLNDIYYVISKKNKPVKIEKDIILINTGCITNDHNFRFRLAFLIEQIAEYNPKRIGIDITFEVEKDKFSDSVLKEAILKNDVVTAFDFKYSHKNIFTHKSKGIVNFPTKQNETIRKYYNYVIIGNDTIPSFASALTQTKNKKSIEYINYCTEFSGYYNIIDEETEINTNNFSAIEAIDFLDATKINLISDLIKDKFVIIGHLGSPNMNNKFDNEDKFKVPTDSMLLNRIPIMPGAVIHANAAQMMLNNEHFLAIEGWQFEIISTLILFVYVFLFYTIKNKFKLKKIINLMITLVSSFILILIGCVYLMDLGVYIAIGGLCAQIALIEGFIDIEADFLTIINKDKKDEME